MVAAVLPLTQILPVVFYNEEFEAEKGVALGLSLWGFVSYFYGEYKLTKKPKDIAQSSQQAVDLVKTDYSLYYWCCISIYVHCIIEVTCKICFFFFFLLLEAKFTKTIITSPISTSRLVQCSILKNKLFGKFLEYFFPRTLPFYVQ